MSLESRARKAQKQEEKEQMLVATKLVKTVDSILAIMKEENLKIYECDLVVSLLSKRVKDTANGYVGNLFAKDVIL